jgi:hypothetical protein
VPPFENRRMRKLHNAEIVSVARFLKVLKKARSKYYFCFSFEKTSSAKMFAILKSEADPYSVNPYSETGFLVNFGTKIERKKFFFFIKGFPKGLIRLHIGKVFNPPKRTSST